MPHSLIKHRSLPFQWWTENGLLLTSRRRALPQRSLYQNISQLFLRRLKSTLFDHLQGDAQMNLGLSADIALGVCLSIFISTVAYRLLYGVRRGRGADWLINAGQGHGRQGEASKIDLDARTLATLRKLGETKVRQ